MGVNRPGETENPQLGKDESICFWNTNMLANRDALGRTDQQSVLCVSFFSSSLEREGCFVFYFGFGFRLPIAYFQYSHLGTSFLLLFMLL